MKNFLVRSQYKVAPNIALIKYWGKYHEDLIIPLNTSVSMTLSTDDIATKTSLEFGNHVGEDTLILNNKKAPITGRITRLLEYFRNEHNKQLMKKFNLSASEVKNGRFKITSSNNFPTASGLASSASGLACLTMCLQEAFEFKPEYEGHLTVLARLGSGSACRSVYGGIVEWRGVNPSLLDAKNVNIDEISRLSIAKQLFKQEHVKDWNVLVVIASSREKETSSTIGMRNTVLTSPLIQHRVRHTVPERVDAIVKAIRDKDLNTVAEIMIKDSNQFHACCLDTYPPLLYLNHTSSLVISAIHKLNEILPIKLGYTFDAGPNAVILAHDSVIDLVNKFFVELFGVPQERLNEKASKGSTSQITNTQVSNLLAELQKKWKDEIALARVYHLLRTRVGDDPQKLSE